MLYSKHLVPVKPILFKEFECVQCGSRDLETHGVVFSGIHVLGRYTCKSCGSEFHRDLPIGFSIDHPMIISKDQKLFGGEKGWEWISEPLLNGFKNKNDKEVQVERIVYKEESKVIILNTMDYLYGHVLLKLYNAVHYMEQNPDKGLILILPKMFSWLIPEGVAEAWLVDQRLGQTHGWHTKLDKWVQEQLTRFDQVELGKGYAHPEFYDLNIKSFTGVEPFPMEDFLTLRPHITFVARTDRIWFPNKTDRFIYRVFSKLGFKQSLGKLWIRQQNRLMERTMARISKEIPEAGFSVVGIGKVGKFNAKVNDLRTDRMSDDIERSWCEVYAKSQIVIGIHGSNMLLPTAHAAGCIEILPDDRFGNIVQDVSVRYQDRMQLFLYRFVDEYASSSTVAKHAISMFKDFAVYYKDNRINIFDKAE